MEGGSLLEALKPFLPEELLPGSVLDSLSIAMTQIELFQSIESSSGFYNLFKTLPLEIRQGFLKILFQEESPELEDFILYIACEESRKNGFLSDTEAQSFLKDRSE